MTVGDWLVMVWAVATGLVLFVGLARALDTPSPRRPRRGSTSRRLSERVRAAGTEGDVLPSTVAPAEATVTERGSWARAAVARSPVVEVRPKEAGTAPSGEQGPRAFQDRGVPVAPREPARDVALRVDDESPPGESPAEPREGRSPRPAPLEPEPRSASLMGPADRPPAPAPQPVRGPEPGSPTGHLAASIAWRQEPSAQRPVLDLERREPSAVAVEPPRVAVETPAVAERLSRVVVEPDAATGVSRDAGPDTVLRCLELGEAGFHDEVVALATEGLAHGAAPVEGSLPAGELPAVDRAALVSLLTRGRMAVGEAAGAEAALPALDQLDVDPSESRTAHRLRRIGGRIGRQLLRGAEAAAEGSEERVSMLQAAVTWFGWTQSAGPEDGDGTALAEHARDGLTVARQQRIEGLVGHEEFAEALRHLAVTLSMGEVEEEQRQALDDLVWASLTGEMGRLTGQALHGPWGRKAMGAMREAERLLRSPLVKKLPRERRQDLDRRLQWAYLTLGNSRVEAGDLPGALEALARAVGMAPPKGAALRGGLPALAVAVEALVSRWSDRILGLAQDGDREAAMSEARDLSRVIDAAFSRGLTADDLRGAAERRQTLLLEIAAGRAP